jgi:hypothetical protein
LNFLAKFAIILILIPSLFRYIFAGGVSESDISRASLEFLRIAGVFAFALFYLANVARKHKDQLIGTLQTDLFKLFFYTYLLLTVFCVFFYQQGGTFIYVLLALACALFTFLNGKCAKMF